MHTVLVVGLILTPLCALALLIAGERTANAAVIAESGGGWRAWYRVDQLQRVLWRLGFAAGVVCLAVAGIAALLRL